MHMEIHTGQALPLVGGLLLATQPYNNFVRNEQEIDKRRTFRAFDCLDQVTHKAVRAEEQRS